MDFYITIIMGTVPIRWMAQFSISFPFSSSHAPEFHTFSAMIPRTVLRNERWCYMPQPHAPLAKRKLTSRHLSDAQQNIGQYQFNIII